MEPGLLFQTQKSIVRTKEMYYLSNKSLKAEFTGAVFIVTCSHPILFKQSLLKYKKNHTTKTPKQNNKKHHHHHHKKLPSKQTKTPITQPANGISKLWR